MNGTKFKKFQTSWSTTQIIFVEQSVQERTRSRASKPHVLENCVGPHSLTEGHLCPLPCAAQARWGCLSPPPTPRGRLRRAEGLKLRGRCVARPRGHISVSRASGCGPNDAPPSLARLHSQKTLSQLHFVRISTEAQDFFTWRKISNVLFSQCLYVCQA